MKILLSRAMGWLIALLLATSTALAQERAAFRQPELDQMLAPVALYPDALLSQILMASTYPLEIVQAARWSRARPGLEGQAAVEAATSMDWDPSVKSLTAFPRLLATMDEKLDWTERLGEAFLAQPGDVMATIQGLRARAEAAGHLHSSDHLRVARHDGAIVIEPPHPHVVYVPYYDPAIVYGSWWWPGFPPVYWAPPPAYTVGHVYGPGLAWGNGIVIAAGVFFGTLDWFHRHVTVVHVRHDHVHARPVRVHTAWTHNPIHRRGAPLRHAGAIRQVETARIAGARRNIAPNPPAARPPVRGAAVEFRPRPPDVRVRATVHREAARASPPASVAPAPVAVAPRARPATTAVPKHGDFRPPAVGQGVRATSNGNIRLEPGESAALAGPGPRRAAPQTIAPRPVVRTPASRAAAPAVPAPRAMRTPQPVRDARAPARVANRAAVGRSAGGAGTRPAGNRPVRTISPARVPGRP